jgi:hypothetical protein
MDAPIWELIIRGITFVVAAGTAAVLIRLWAVHHTRRHPVRFLTAYMVGVVVALAINRLYVLWVGTQHDVDGSYALHVEPVVRTIGASLLILLTLGVGMVALFHVRHSADG